jgi:release factor glutamine methyltransferase
MLSNTKTIFDQLCNELADMYDEREIKLIIFRLLEDHLEISPSDILAGKEIALTPELEMAIGKSLRRLKKKEPIQYVLGKAHFFGREFIVDRNVLIPRQETEELVDWIISSQHQVEHILDIGTGSGCIAISLAMRYKGKQVTAWDISNQALTMAAKNARHHQVPVHFEMIDVLSTDVPANTFDLIVSNPPYIPTQQQAYMHANVLDFEPASALFVSDNKPLIFYSAICHLADCILRPGGWLYFEINELFGDQVVQMLEDYSFKDTELKRDINGKDRMVRGRRP